MALHARCVAVTAGARGDCVEKVANLLVKAGHVKVDKAREILASLGPADAHGQPERSRPAGRGLRAAPPRRPARRTGARSPRRSARERSSSSASTRWCTATRRSPVPLSLGVTARGTPADSCELGGAPGRSAAPQRAACSPMPSPARRRRPAAAGAVPLDGDLPVVDGARAARRRSPVACPGCCSARRGRAPTPSRCSRWRCAWSRSSTARPPGVDHTCSAHGAPPLPASGAGPSRAGWRQSAGPLQRAGGLALVGAAQRTQETVAALRERQARWPERYGAAVPGDGPAGGGGRAGASRTGDLEALGDAMNVNHGLLAAAGVCSPALDADGGHGCAAPGRSARSSPAPAGTAGRWSPVPEGPGRRWRWSWPGSAVLHQPARGPRPHEPLASDRARPSEHRPGEVLGEARHGAHPPAPVEPLAHPGSAGGGDHGRVRRAPRTRWCCTGRGPGQASGRACWPPRAGAERDDPALGPVRVRLARQLPDGGGAGLERRRLRGAGAGRAGGGGAARATRRRSLPWRGWAAARRAGACRAASASGTAAAARTARTASPTQALPRRPLAGAAHGGRGAEPRREGGR